MISNVHPQSYSLKALLNVCHLYLEMYTERFVVKRLFRAKIVSTCLVAPAIYFLLLFQGQNVSL